MSLSQRAKKRFFGSLSKRKKLKNSRIEGDTPTVILRSRPPIPEFMSPSPSFDDPVGHLHASTSLPDQLDKSGISDIAAVSYQSCLHLDTNTPSATYLHHAESSTLNCHPANNHTSETQSWASPVGVISNHEDTHQHTDHSVSTVENTLDFRLKPAGHSEYTISEVTCSPSNTKKLQNNASQHEGSIGTDIESKKLTNKHEVTKSRSTSSIDVILAESLDGDQFVNSLFSDIIETYNYPENYHTSEHLTVDGPAVTSENASLFGDIEINDDVFSPSDDELHFSASHTNSIPKSDGPLDYTVRNDNSNTTYSEYPHQRTEDNGNKIVKNDGSASNEDLACSQDESSSTSFVLKQIRFFESYNEQTGSSSPSSDFSNKSTPTSPSNDIPPPTTNLQTLKSANKKPNLTPLKTKSVSFSDNKGEATPKFVKLPKQVSSFRVFKNSTFTNPRLNFSPFKRSGSIPEVVAMCRCGQFCEGECSDFGNAKVQDKRQGLRSYDGISGIKTSSQQVM